MKWDEGLLYIRRSHSRGTDVMNTTKSRKRQSIPLPKELIDILPWQAAQLPGGPMSESDLLFPSTTGEFRAPSSLQRPFAGVAKRIGLTKRITARAMRRTFQDRAGRVPRGARNNEHEGIQWYA